MPASASAHSKPLEAAPRFGEPAPPKAFASTRRASWFTKASDSSIHVVVESSLALDCGVESRLELAGLASLASERARAASSEPRGPQRPAHGRRLCQSAIERQVLFRRVEAPCAFKAAEMVFCRSTPSEVGLSAPLRLITASIEHPAPCRERRGVTAP